MDAQCKRDQEICGVLSDGLTIVPRGFECINTRSHKESCKYAAVYPSYSTLICSLGGGCVLPIFAKQKRGQDCTSIVGALDVSCIDSTCVVHTCNDDFVVSDDESTCLPVLTLEGRDTTVAGNAPGHVGNLASSVKATSTFATKAIRRKATSTSTLSLGPADKVFKLDPKILMSLVTADDPFAVLAKAYTAVHGNSKRGTNPIPIVPSIAYASTGMEGLDLVDSL